MTLISQISECLSNTYMHFLLTLQHFVLQKKKKKNKTQNSQTILNIERGKKCFLATASNPETYATKAI